MSSSETKSAPLILNEASTKDVSDSETQRKDQERNPVYDFLYHDARRIASFLAQFKTYGVPQNVKASESAGRATSTKTAISAGGGVPLVAQGQAALDQTNTSDERDATEHTYDPLWRNALDLRDYLEEEGLINRDITAANIGQFIIASGELTVLNAAVMRETWVSPILRAGAVKQAMNVAQAKCRANPANAALKGPDKAKAERTAMETAKFNAEVAIDNLKYYPHSINCIIKGDGFSAWAPLHEEGITGAATDLALMHGSEVPGLWNLLGILDARPSPIPAQEIILPSEVPLHFAPSIKNFANMAGTLLGRSPEAYGMTALLLFREVMPGSAGT
jgi:hypothetical protein